MVMYVLREEEARCTEFSCDLRLRMMSLFRRIFGGAIASSAFLNLLLPSACKIHYAMAMFVRILQGLIEVTPICCDRVAYLQALLV